MAATVQALAAGIPAASSGSVEFFQLGTSTLSTLVYSDSAGLNAVTSTALDANGFAARYIGEPVTVRVYTSSRALLREFDDLGDAKCIRLESPAFTGPNDDGAIVAGGTTTEQDAWGLFLQSFGATDAYVGVSGSAVLLKTLLAAQNTGIFYNVIAYGADPTDVSDSTAYVQAAINAASNAGGGVVYVPPGTYKIIAQLSLPLGVFMFGVPGGNSVLRMETNNVNGLVTASNASVFGISFMQEAARTGAFLRASGLCHVYQCSFTMTKGTAIYAITTGCDLRVYDCYFDRTVTSANTCFLDAAVATAYTRFTDCWFDVSSGATPPTVQFDTTGTVEMSNCHIKHEVGASSIFSAATTAIVTGGVIEHTGASARCRSAWAHSPSRGRASSAPRAGRSSSSPVRRRSPTWAATSTRRIATSPWGP